jgi:hypothetical protein
VGRDSLDYLDQGMALAFERGNRPDYLVCHPRRYQQVEQVVNQDSLDDSDQDKRRAVHWDIDPRDRRDRPYHCQPVGAALSAPARPLFANNPAPK